MSLSIVVDPRDLATRELWSDSEFGRALRGLTDARVTEVLPAEVLLHLYAAELTERARETVSRGDTLLRVPFWPRALLLGEGVEPNAALEFEAILPAHGVVAHEAAPSVLVMAARELLGGFVFDPFSYRDQLRSLAATSSFVWHAEAESAQAVTASALIWAKGLVLLERRSLLARVSPGQLDTFGGHVEANESVRSALVRELNEELGISPIAPRCVAAYERYEDPPGKLYHHGVWLVDKWHGVEAASLNVGVWLRPEQAVEDPCLNSALLPILRRCLDAPPLTRFDDSDHIARD